MKHRVAVLSITIVCLLLICLSTFADSLSIGKAKLLFDSYTTLSDNFDPAVADLYADDAVIKMHKTDPSGETREMQMNGTQFKNSLRLSMPIAKARGDVDVFNDVTYTEEGKNVRIKASRFNKMKNYTMPHEIVVGPDASGEWKILEEVANSE